MFNLFKKKIRKCDNCSKPLEKYHVFDPTHWGLYRDSKKMNLCTFCMIKKYKEYLNNFHGKAIFVEPMKNYIAYPYYTFEEILKEDYWPKEGIDELKGLVNQDGNCAKCGKETHFLLCSPEIYQNNPIKPFNIKNNNFSKSFLCVDCLCDHLENIIVQNNIYFNCIYPPRDGDGLATSFNP
ncbi:MAG: hypothetical protein KAU07_01245 [Candidatus Andersenbacteria bacterium]|nr:hypothetical protein [Candidatus Andersenbacteria bacterium]